MAKLVYRAAWICPLLVIALAVIAGTMHPSIPAALLLGFLVLPVAGVVLGLIAKPRATGAVRLGAVELVLTVGVALLLPSLCRPREQANPIKCASNLKQIYLQLDAYANRHNGALPKSLDELISDPGSDMTPDVLICSSSQDARADAATPAESAKIIREQSGHLSYVYVAAGLDAKALPHDLVVAYDKPHNHKDAMNVLYGDGHVDFQPQPAADRILAELAAGHNPPRPPSSQP